MKNKIKINDIFAYMLGNYRMIIYDSGLTFLLRKHIIEQYEWRLTKMNPQCFLSGSCVKCGCDTPALQMANKACDGGCYFEMFSKKKWKEFKIREEKRKEVKKFDHTRANYLGFEVHTPYIAGIDPMKLKKISFEEYTSGIIPDFSKTKQIKLKKKDDSL